MELFTEEDIMEWNKDRIKSLRKRLGWTQQQLADKLGVSKRAVRYWEKGKRAPSSEILPKLDNLASPTSEGKSFPKEEQGEQQKGEQQKGEQGEQEEQPKKVTGDNVTDKNMTDSNVKSESEQSSKVNSDEQVNSGEQVTDENVNSEEVSNPSVSNQEVGKNTVRIKKEHLRATYAMLAHQTPVELRIFPKNGYPVVETDSTEDELIPISERWNGKAQIYCGMRERRAGFLDDKPKGKAGDENDVVAVALTVVDIDPIRAEGFAKQATTDEELAYALKASEHLARWHEARGFLRPSRAMSGNGVQLWLPFPRWEVTEENRAVIPERLKNFEQECRDALPNDLREKFTIDSIHDLPRIIKVIGTTSVKGDNTPERPHRVSYWVDDERSPLKIGRQEDEKFLEYLQTAVSLASLAKQSASVYSQPRQPELKAQTGRETAPKTSEKRKTSDRASTTTQHTSSASPQRELDWQECEFLQECWDNATSLSEPLWYAMLSNLSRFGNEGRQLAHQLSKPYPGYSASEMDKKFDHAFTASGPMTCNEITNKGFRCPSLRRCKANAPASLIGQLSGITIVCPELEEYELITTPKQKTIIPLELEKVIPPDSYLSRYMEYASELTDAPNQFHVFSALSALSTVIGNRVYLPWGDGRLYPNLWIVIVAPSSIYRKTTAIRIACNLIRHVEEAKILPDEFSPESLLHVLESRPQGLFFWGELRSKLAYFQRSYMAGMQAMLTELYDCPPIYKRTLLGNSYRVENPCLGILAASTKEWLRASITEGDMKGGFLQRFMYVLAHRKEKHLAIPSHTDMPKQNELVIMLNRARTFECIIDLTDIRDAFTEWHFKHEQEAMNADNEEVKASFYARLDSYCLKLTMLYEIAMQMTATDFPFGELRPSQEALTYAINLIDYAKATINYMLSEELVFTREMANRQKVLGLIENSPGISRKTVMQNAHLLKRDLDLILETLEGEGTIAIRKEGQRGGQHYYPVREKS